MSNARPLLQECDIPVPLSGIAMATSPRSLVSVPKVLRKFLTGDVTPVEVKAWIEEAFRIESHLPALGPRGYARAQIRPLVQRRQRHVGNPVNTIFPVNGEEILLHWQVAMSWFRLLDRHEAEMLKLKFKGVRQNKIAKIYSMREPELSQQLKASFQKIADYLNACPGEQVEVPPKWEGVDRDQGVN